MKIKQLYHFPNNLIDFVRFLGPPTREMGKHPKKCGHLTFSRSQSK